jgi:hypothetical protein
MRIHYLDALRYRLPDDERKRAMILLVVFQCAAMMFEPSGSGRLESYTAA